MQVLEIFAELISAIAALGALGAAVWAARVSKRLYDVETSRDLRSSERAEKEQASGIAAWCIVLRGEGLNREYGVLVHNSSDAPVFDVEVLSTYSTKQDLEPVRQPPLGLTILPPGDYVAYRDEQYNWTYPEERRSIDGAVRPVTKNANWIVTQIRFTDSHGTRWARRGGRLEKLAEADA